MRRDPGGEKTKSGMAALRKVICVDDNRILLQVLDWYLKSRGYAVLPCSNGSAALNLLTEDRVDAVVVDYRMPDIDGGEVAAAIRSRTPEVPIIMYSGMTDIPQQTLRLVDCFVRKGQADAFQVLGDFLDSWFSKSARRNSPTNSGGTTRHSVRPHRRSGAAT